MTYPRGSTQPCHLPKPGDLIGNYRIEGDLADGGMGTVHRATHVFLPRRAAIKILHGTMLYVPSAIDRMLQEARILELMQHPSFVRIYDVGRLDDGRPWVAMELIEGETLSDFGERRGPLPLRDVARILVELSEALMLAHSVQIVHRDVKPENILVTEDRENGAFSVKLIDWGIAQVASGPRFTQEDVTPGTPHYMSPEVLLGQAAVHTSDIYSLGVVGYELLVGEPPFAGESAIDIAYNHLHHEPAPLLPHRPDVPRWVEQLLTAMMDRDPAARPSLRVVQRAFMTEALRPTEDELAPIIEIQVDEDAQYYDEIQTAA